MKTITILYLIVICFVSSLRPSCDQNVIFEAGFNNTLQSVEGEAPMNTSNISFSNSLKEAGILVEERDILQYNITNNIMATTGRGASSISRILISCRPD